MLRISTQRAGGIRLFNSVFVWAKAQSEARHDPGCARHPV